jgi:sulfur-carrier protein
MTQPDEIKPAPGTLTIVYFAWVREQVGRARETIAPPAAVATVADLIAWLRTRGPEYESAFARPDVIRTAIDSTRWRPRNRFLPAGHRRVA